MPVYADHNATTPCLPAAADLARRIMAEDFGNPSSRHSPGGRAARAHLDQARQRVAAAVGAREDEITFTSGATEACNAAIFGVVQRLLGRRPVLLAPATEHPAVLEPLRRCAEAGADLAELPVDTQGRLDPATLAERLNDAVGLVCVMLANNESGVLQDIPPLAAAAHDAGALFLCDTTQALGKTPVDVSRLGADFATFSAHKCYGPKGVGALWKRRGLAIDPLLFGGGQEAALRPGTENVAGIAAFGLAVELTTSRADLGQRLAARTARLETALLDRLPGIVIHGREADRVPGTTFVTLPGLPRGWLAQLSDITVSSGSSCASAHGEPSHVLRAMGVAEPDAANAVRISFGAGTTEAEVDHVARRLVEGANRLQEHSPHD